jgi:hypothetical protein
METPIELGNNIQRSKDQLEKRFESHVKENNKEIMSVKRDVGVMNKIMKIEMKLNKVILDESWNKNCENTERELRDVGSDLIETSKR